VHVDEREAAGGVPAAEQDGVGVPHHPHLLWAVSVRTSALGEAALAGTPLTLAGLGLLENVNARPGITIAEISRRAPQTQQALIALLEEMRTVVGELARARDAP
jgi:hypothetical protein